MNTLKIRELIITAMLVALAVVIPLFMPIKIPIPPTTVTAASHVPSIIAMFLSPFSVVLVGLGNALAFMSMSPIVAARASTHIIFGLFGYYLIYKKNCNFLLTVFLTMLLHGIAEGVVIYAFMVGQTGVWAGVSTTVITTWLHHLIDFTIATPIIIALDKAKYINYSILRKRG